MPDYHATIMNHTAKKDVLNILASWCLVKDPFGFKSMKDEEIVEKASHISMFNDMDHYLSLTINAELPVNMKNRMIAYVNPSHYIMQESFDSITIICAKSCYDWRIFITKILRDYKNGCADRDILMSGAIIAEACKEEIPYLFDSIVEQYNKNFDEDNISQE